MRKNITLKSISLGIIKAIIFVILTLIIQNILFIPLSEISKAFWSKFDGSGLNEPWFISTSIVILFSVLVVCFVFLKYIEKEKWSFIRFTFTKCIKLFSSGFIVTSIIVIFFTLINVLTGNIEVSLNFSSITNIFIYFFVINIGALAIVVYEEIVCRGYVLQVIEKHINRITAIILSSCVFGIAHFLNPNTSILGIINISLAGIFLAIICIHVNNLWMPIGVHFGWNFLLWFFNYPVSGQRFPNPILELNYNEYNLFTGSKFGPEDSLLFTIILVALIVYYIYKHRIDKTIIFGTNTK